MTNPKVLACACRTRKAAFGRYRGESKKIFNTESRGAPWLTNRYLGAFSCKHAHSCGARI